MILSKPYDANSLFAVQTKQYQEILLMSGDVPAGQSVLFKTGVSSLGAFYCKFMTGRFSGLNLSGSPAAIVGDGICHLRGKLSDGSTQKQLFNDFVPLDLLFSPGYVRNMSDTLIGATSAPFSPLSNNLFYPVPFEYIFPENSDILMEVKNDSLTDNYFDIAFHGIRLIK